MNSSYKAKDYPVDIEYLINLAKERAITSWEREFINKMIGNWDSWGLGMYLSEKQAIILFRIADVPYQPPRYPGYTEEKPKQKTTDFSSDLLKRLIILCHPDKHNQSEMSIKVTQELLKLRG